MSSRQTSIAASSDGALSRTIDAETSGNAPASTITPASFSSTILARCAARNGTRVSAASGAYVASTNQMLSICGSPAGSAADMDHLSRLQDATQAKGLNDPVEQLA